MVQDLSQTDDPPEIRREIPILNWLINYQREDLVGDSIAGLTIAVMLVPQSLAYALLAGLPPIVGLYASIIPVMIYGLLGSTRVMTLGPTAITSVMTLGTISTIVVSSGGSLASLALTLALFLGIVYLLMGVLRLGFIVNLLSRPVLVGYVNAAALIIAISQLPHLLGVEIVNSSYPHLIFWRTIINIGHSNFATMIIGILGISLLLFFRYGLDPLLGHLRLPQLLRFAITRSGALVLVMLSIAIVYAFGLNDTADVAIVGTIPSGIPTLTLDFDFTHWRALLLGAIAIAFVGLMEDVSTAKSLMKGRDQRLIPNQEMIAMGAANIASAFTGGLPVTTSISRSAVNHAVGAKTGLSSIIAGGLLTITVIFLTRFFYFLPHATLGAIILVSIINLIDLKTMMEIWRYSRTEACVVLLTVVSVFIFNIAIGILVGIVLSVGLHIYRTSRTPIVELGRDRESEYYANITFDWVRPIPRVLILRIDESLYFANAQFLDRYIRNIVSQRKDVQHLILVCSAVNTLDTTSIQILEELVKDFQQIGVQVLISEMRDRAINRVKAGELRHLIGDDRFFATTHDAVKSTEQLPQ